MKNKLMILIKISKKINDSKIFNKKLVLGNGLFSILLPLIASTIIPALIPKKDLVFPTKTIFFEQIKNKYPEFFDKKIIRLVISL